MSSDQQPVPSTPLEAIEAAAAVWLSLRDRGMTPEETSAFLSWLEGDPRHARVFAELDATWQRLDAFSNAPLAAGASRPRRSWRPTFFALGAAAVFVLGILVTLAVRGPRHTAETELGGFRKLELPDGSVAQLNTDSAIDVAYGATERRVRVARGEVFFTVSKDPSRPFFVAVGPVVVRAVGTAFNVRHRSDAVEVLVTEGRVTVSELATAKEPAKATIPIVSAGERAVVQVERKGAVTGPLPTRVVSLPAPEVQRALAWQERRLEFEETELREVIREFNRYDRRKLVITDEALAGRRFSGTFRADGRDSFVRLLETSFGVVAEDRGGEILLHAGHAAPTSVAP